MLSERRRVLDNEFPLLTRVHLGPHEDAARLYILDNRALEIRHEVAQFLRFSYTELRAILNMFYEEEEQEIEKVKKRHSYYQFEGGGTGVPAVSLYQFRKQCIRRVDGP